MKYDWKKIIEDQGNSGLSINKYCHENKINISSFYANRKKLSDEVSNDNVFLPVEVIEPKSTLVSMNIDGHTVEFDSSLLDKVIGALR